MTQFLIEILSIVIISLVFSKNMVTLKNECSPSTPGRILAAVAFGGMIFILLITLWQHHQPQAVLNYYQDNSLLNAHGRNIVNVILVDFRAIDTLGEILVVFGVAVSIFAYLRRRHSEN